MPPAFCQIPFVFMLHDLHHVSMIDESSRGRRAFYELLIKPRARSAASIVTVSNHSKSEILAWTGIDEERVVVAYNGVSSEFTPEGERASGEGDYILYVGNQKPHKNVPALIDAYCHLPSDGRPKLLLTGKPTRPIRCQIDRLRLTNSVGFLGHVSDEGLAALYRGALLLAIPSLNEGFGLPAVEAMASGCPTVCSNTGALPEIVGDAGCFCDPFSSESISSAMLRVLSDSKLREQLRQNGIERSRMFRWDRFASEVYESVVRAFEID
ncbi:glycosyltransferase family 4 protein [Kolteria novifilia]